MNEINNLIVFPQKILSDKKVTPSAKLMYIQSYHEALNNKYCDLTNADFGKLFGLSTSRVSKLLHELEENCYVNIVVERTNKECGTNRKIYITQKGVIHE